MQHELSSDYSLNICFWRPFPHIDGPFSPYKPLQNSTFERSVTFSFPGIVLTNFEDMFLVKIASKGTSLSHYISYDLV